MMTTLKKCAWLSVAATLMLPSCDMSSDPAPTYIWAVGTAQRLDADTTRWWLEDDNEVSYYPHEWAGSSPRSGTRITAYMELVSVEPPEGYDYVVKMRELTRVVTNPITSTDEQTVDTMRSDDIVVMGAFVSSHYLNITVSVMGYKEAEHPHSFYLLRDSTQKNEPIQLTLCHRLNGDSPYYELRGTLSFDLETLAERGTKDSVSVQLKATYTYGGSRNFRYAFQQ